ncbi:MAG: sensor histidine kinase [Vulcanimicrobiota bacterium]
MACKEFIAWESGLETAVLDPQGIIVEANPAMRALCQGCHSLQDLLVAEDWHGLECSRRRVRLRCARSADLILTGLESGCWLAQLHLSDALDLTREFYHRARNHLAVISSLLQMQSNLLQDQAARQAFADCQMRVQCLALLYGQVHTPGAGLDFAAHLRRLIELLLPEGSPVELQLQPLQSSLDEAVPLSLITHELVANSLKHASGAKLEIVLLVGPEKVCLTVADGGPGLPPEVVPQRATSLGLRLVRTLARQLRAEVNWGTGSGTRCGLTFSLKGAV